MEQRRLLKDSEQFLALLVRQGRYKADSGRPWAAALQSVVPVAVCGSGWLASCTRGQSSPIRSRMATWNLTPLSEISACCRNVSTGTSRTADLHFSSEVLDELCCWQGTRNIAMMLDRCGAYEEISLCFVGVVIILWAWQVLGMPCCSSNYEDDDLVVLENPARMKGPGGLSAGHGHLGDMILGLICHWACMHFVASRHWPAGFLSLHTSFSGWLAGQARACCQHLRSTTLFGVLCFCARFHHRDVRCDVIELKISANCSLRGRFLLF